MLPRPASSTLAHPNINMLSYQTTPQQEHGISIVGIGGAGAGILQCFGSSSADNVRLYTLSLDERMGRSSGSNVQFIQLGGGLNHGLGSGGDPEVGRRAAEESRAELEAILEDSKLLVLVTGLGGGTGSGAAPVLAQIAREKGVFLVSVVLMPFSFEGKRRRRQAEKAQEEIARLTDILFCFENDYMEKLFSNNRGARAVFEEVDRIMAKATAAVPMLATSPGLINLGLDELAIALENNDSRCLFGSGKGYGPHRAEQAARNALDSPLISYRGALQHSRTVIVHVAGGESISLHEIRIAVETVKNALKDDDVSIFFGTTVKPHLGDEIRVTLIASVNAGEFAAAAAKAEAEAEQTLPPQNDPPAPTIKEEEPAPVAEPAEENEAPMAAPAEEPATPAEEAPYEPEESAAEEEADEPAPQEQTLYQGELMPATTTAELTDAERVARARSLFAEVDGNADVLNQYTAARRRTNTPTADDADTPPALRVNDLRAFFPDHTK